MITFTVQKEITEEDWCDHVFGSGAGGYPWWADLYQNPSGDVVIKHIDPDSETYYSDTPETYYTTLQKIADTASVIALEYKTVAEAIIEDDFDANDMDIVLQSVVFGEIVYG